MCRYTKLKQYVYFTKPWVIKNFCYACCASCECVCNFMQNLPFQLHMYIRIWNFTFIFLFRGTCDLFNLWYLIHETLMLCRHQSDEEEIEETEYRYKHWTDENWVQKQIMEWASTLIERVRCLVDFVRDERFLKDIAI